MTDYPTLHLDTNKSKGTVQTIQHYTWTQTKVKEHDRLSNITLKHKLK
jgi:hypothetical protein